MNPFQTQTKKNYSQSYRFLVAGIIVLGQLLGAPLALADDANPPRLADLQEWVRLRILRDQAQAGAAATKLSVQPEPRSNAVEPYAARITEQNPAAVFLLIDESNFATARSVQTGRSNPEEIAFAANRTLTDLLNTCATGDMSPDGQPTFKDRFRFWAIGYSNYYGLEWIRDLIEPGATPTMLDKLATYEAAADGPIGNWIVPDATTPGGTPMAKVLRRIYNPAADFMRQHPNGHAVVLNITAGFPTDLEKTVSAAHDLMSLRNDNGNLLLLNAVFLTGSSKSVLYPNSYGQIDDRGGKNMFGMSSELPPLALTVTKRLRGARGLVVNRVPRQLAQFFRIGTQTLIENR